MRKGIILVLVILLAIILAIPYLDGYFFKSTFLNQINASANQAGEKALKIDVQEYNLGWLSSDVKLRILPVKENTKKYLASGFSMDYHISHGPLAYDSAANKYVFAYATISGEVNLPPELQKIFGNQNKQPWMITQSKVSFDNVWEQTVSFTPQIIPQFGTLKIGDSNAVSQFTIENNVIKQIQINGTVGAISLQADPKNPFAPDVSIQPMSFKQNSILQPIGLWNADGTFSIPDIFIKSKDNGLNINNFSLHSVRGIDANNLYNSDLAISMEKMDIKNKLTSPFSPFSFKLDFKLNNLSPAGLMAYYDYLEKNSISFSPEYQKQLVNLWANIFTPTSNVDTNIALTTSQGILSVQIKASLKPGTAVPQTQEEAMKNIMVEANTRIAAPLLSKVLELQIAQQNAVIAQQASLSQVATVPQNQNSPIQVAVVNSLQQGKISLQVSIQILGLAHQNLPMNEFIAKVNTMISPAVAAPLIQAYQDTLSEKAAVQAAVPKVAILTAQQITDQAQKMIDAWVTQGFLVKDNNDYISKVIYDNGVLKVNDKDMSSLLQMMPVHGTMPPPQAMPIPQATSP